MDNSGCAGARNSAFLSKVSESFRQLTRTTPILNYNAGVLQIEFVNKAAAGRADACADAEHAR